MANRVHPRVPVQLFLTEWREHIGPSQEELGGLMGAANSTYRWELWTRDPGHKDARQPDVNTLAAFAEALDIRVIDLYRRPSPHPSFDAVIAKIAKAPEALQVQAAEIMETLLKPWSL